MYHSSDGSGDIENRQGIWTCEDRLTIIFYWSVLIKLSLESHSQTVTLFRIYFDYLPFLQTEKLISEQIWGGKIRTNKLILAFFYCNFFFLMSKNMKRWWDAFFKNPVHIHGSTTGIHAHIPDLFNQLDYRISQDISLQYNIILYCVPVFRSSSFFWKYF